MRRSSHQKGFTLIELLVSVGIMVILMAVVVTGFRGGQDGDALRIASQRLVASLETARTQATAGMLMVDSTAPRGYGVNIAEATPTTANPAFITSFADSATAGTSGRLDATADNTTIERLDGSRMFPVKIAQVAYCQGFNATTGAPILPTTPMTSGMVDIAFTLPHGTATIDGLAESTAPVAVCITLASVKTPTMTKTISVNRITGRIDVQF